MFLQRRAGYVFLLACSIIAFTVIIERFMFWLGVDMHRSQTLVAEVLGLCWRSEWETVRVKAAGDELK